MADTKPLVKPATAAAKPPTIPENTIPLPPEAETSRALAANRGVVTSGPAAGENPEDRVPVIARQKAYTSDGRTMEKGERGTIPAKDFNSNVYERISARQALAEAPNTTRQRQLVDTGQAEVPMTDEESAENR